MEEIQKKLIDLLADRYCVDRGPVSGETTLVSLDLDSIDVIELVIDVEEAFGVDIPDEAIESLKTVGDVVRVIDAAQRVAA